jgi:hypothetical protein
MGGEPGESFDQAGSPSEAFQQIPAACEASASHVWALAPTELKSNAIKAMGRALFSVT